MRITKLKFLMLTLALSLTQAYAKTTATELPIYTDAKPVITVSAEESKFIIKLKSNPTTGFSWFLRAYDSNLLEPVGHAYEAPTDKKLMGAPGYEVWTFKTKPASLVVPQRTSIRFTYVRPWEPGEASNQVVFWVTTNSKTP